jgi:hypothetical protein
MNEYELEKEIAEHVNSTDGLVLASFSPQHVDRLVGFIRAAQRTHRTFVADVYTAYILHLNVFFWHGFDWLWLSGKRTASLQSLDGPQPMVDRRRNEAPLSAPSEDAFDSGDSPVYCRPGQPRLNH